MTTGKSKGVLDPKVEIESSLKKDIVGGSSGFCAGGLACQPNAMRQVDTLDKIGTQGLSYEGFQALEIPVKL